MHQTTARFRKLFASLSPEIQARAREAFQLLQTSPQHPSLHFKRVGNLWSVRVTAAIRALAVRDGDVFTWVWIGSHDDYERMIRQA